MIIVCHLQGFPREHRFVIRMGNVPPTPMEAIGERSIRTIRRKPYKRILTKNSKSHNPIKLQTTLFHETCYLIMQNIIFLKLGPQFKKARMRHAQARLSMRLPPRRLGGDEVRLKDARLYLAPFSSFSLPFFFFFPSLDLKGELCLYGKCVHWKNYDNTAHILRLLAVLVVLLIFITFLMHLSNLFMQNMLCEM